MSGLVHLYHGNGKGKTSAAMGLALRAAGRGRRVLVVQFLKGRPSGEVLAFEGMEAVRVLRGKGNRKFVFQMDEAERARERTTQRALFDEAVRAANSGEYGLLVLDEMVDACNSGMVDETALLAFLQDRPPELEVVMTGREPPHRLRAAADYISKIEKEKHPYDKGVLAREGVEY